MSWSGERDCPYAAEGYQRVFNLHIQESIKQVPMGGRMDNDHNFHVFEALAPVGAPIHQRGIVGAASMGPVGMWDSQGVSQSSRLTVQAA